LINKPIIFVLGLENKRKLTRIKSRLWLQSNWTNFSDRSSRVKFIGFLIVGKFINDYSQLVEKRCMITHIKLRKKKVPSLNEFELANLFNQMNNKTNFSKLYNTRV